MEYPNNEKIKKLLEAVAALAEVRAIGQSGSIAAPVAGETDIDLFLLCGSIPSYECRKDLYESLSHLYESCCINVCEGGVWGTGDVFVIDGVDTMLMYFTIEDSLNYIDEVLAGKRLDSEQGFYPVGRCATWKNMTVLYDEMGIFQSIQEKLSVYPGGLRRAMADFHLARVVDREDFGRALQRRDVLFYHQVLEGAIDHFLQALFAVNGTFFPSRKRSKQYIEGFAAKPARCHERLLQVVALGAAEDGIGQSQREWQSLVDELKEIHAKNQ